MPHTQDVRVVFVGSSVGQWVGVRGDGGGGVDRGGGVDGGGCVDGDGVTSSPQ